MGFWKPMGSGIRPKMRDVITQLRDISSVEAINYARTLHNGARVVFCDVANTSGAEDGKTWETAYNTLTEALNAARYDPGTTDLDDDKNQHAYIFIAPGQYNKTTYTSFSGYGLHVIGIARGNADYGVTINYAGTCAGAPSVMVCGGAEIELANMAICCSMAYPALYFTVADKCLINNVHIKGDYANCTYGMQFDNAKHVEIYDSIIEGWETAGIYFNGGADQYFIFNNIHDNLILADSGGTAGGVGILIDSDMTSYGSRIVENYIDVSGCGATAKGIDNNSSNTTKSCFIIRNFAVGDAGFVGMESTQRGMWDNAYSANGTMTLNVDDD